MSQIFDTGAAVDRGVDPSGLVALAFAARGRRLLRSAYRLLDVGERSEAAVLFRVMQEYLITGSWLGLSEENRRVWALDDYRRRVVTIERVSDDKSLEDETKALVKKQAEEAKARLATYRSELPKDDEAAEPEKVCSECARPLTRKKGQTVPSIEQMAKETGMTFAYDLGYRLSSQADLHATTLVVDYTLEQKHDGSISVREQPLFSLGQFESYALGAHLLLDLLRPISNRWPDLDWGPHLDAAQETLEAVRAADPDSQSFKRRRESSSSSPKSDS
jgi:hypothetical protein